MNCGYWASRNYCTQGPYTRYMRESCRKSCRICTSTGTGNSNSIRSTNQRRFLKSMNAHVRFLFTVCEDTDENCGYWATSGYCRHGYYGRFMMMNCRHSCNLCSSRTALPTQRKQNNSILYVINDVTSWLSLQVVGTRTSVVCTGRPVESASPILDTCFPTARSHAVFANKRWPARRATCIERLV